MWKRNVVFVILFCMFLLGPAGIFLCEKVHINLPGWLTAEDSRYLSGGIEKASVRKNLSISGFESEKLQEAIETQIGNNVPMKSTALLINANTQRLAIEASNLAFSWGCYPTYYGSTKVYDASLGALSRMPYAFPEKRGEEFCAFVSKLSNLACEYPEKRFVVYVANLSQVSGVNPAKNYISDGFVSVDDLVLRGQDCVETPNVFILGEDYDSASDYFADFYTTDHHWNGFGCIRAYRNITASMGLDDSMSGDLAVQAFDGLKMNGSNSRLGLMLLNESVCEPVFDLSFVEVVYGAQPPVIKNDVASLKANSQQAEFDFYHAWYGNGNVRLVNESQRGSSKVLLLGDSYTFSMRWLLAANYAELTQAKDFSASVPEQLAKEGTTLRDRIESSGADDIVFIAASGDYGDMARLYPGYFD